MVNERVLLVKVEAAIADDGWVGVGDVDDISEAKCY